MSTRDVPDPVLVIVPTRDRPTMLAEAVRSLLVQTDRDWVAVVADDGEEPAAERVAGALGDDRVYVVRTSARSPGGARNEAFAHGEERVLRRRASVVAFLDDDDLWLPLHLGLVREALSREPDAAFVHTAALTRSAEGVFPYHERGEAPSGQAFVSLLRRNDVATSSVAMPAERLRALGGFRSDLSHGEDWDLWLRASRLGPVRFLAEPTVVYRAHAGNVSREGAAKAADQAKALEHWWDLRHMLSRAERAALRRSLARRHASHVRRLLREGAARSVARAAAREHLHRLPSARTWLAAWGPR